MYLVSRVIISQQRRFAEGEIHSTDYIRKGTLTPPPPRFSHQCHDLLDPRRARLAKRAHENIVVSRLESSDQLVRRFFLSNPMPPTPPMPYQTRQDKNRPAPSRNEGRKVFIRAKWSELAAQSQGKSKVGGVPCPI